jgi:O-Antigen ligase
VPLPGYSAQARPPRPTYALVTLLGLFSIVVLRLPVLFGHYSITQPLAIVPFVLAILWALPRPRLSPPDRAQTTIVFLLVLITGVALVRSSKADIYSLGSMPAVLVAFLGLVGLGIIYFSTSRLSTTARVQIAMGFLVGLIAAFALVRTSTADVTNSLGSVVVEAVQYIVLVAFAILYVSTSRDRKELNRRLICLALAPGVYAAVNVLLFLVGVQAPVDPSLSSSTQGSASQILTALGLPGTRIRFALATSVNLFGVAAAGGLVAAVVLMLRVPRAPKKLAVLAAAASLLCVLLCDSRAALAMSIAVVFYFAVAPRARASGGAALLIPFLPLLVIGSIALLDSFGLTSALSRDAAGTDFASATGRTLIWSQGWDVFSHPSWIHLIGWGASGQVTSGASLHWAFQFQGVVADPAATSTHSLLLQTLFDTGYLGLGVLVAALTMTCVRLGRVVRSDPASPAVALLAIVIVVILCGATEAAPTILSQEAFAIVLLICGAAASIPTGRVGATTAPPAPTAQLHEPIGRRHAVPVHAGLR